IGAGLRPLHQGKNDAIYCTAWVCCWHETPGRSMMSLPSFRPPLARALELGSAKSGVQLLLGGTHHSRRGLCLCALWFGTSIIAHSGSDCAAFVAWIRTPRGNPSPHCVRSE